MAMFRQLALASVLFVFCFSAWSQTVYEEMTVQVKQLHVNVVGKGGEPVTGLTAADFEVLLEGRSQEIVSVVPITLEQTVASGDQAPSATPVPEYGRRMFVFVFDMQYNNPSDIVRARRYAYEFIRDDMLDNDLVALFTLGGSQIRMITNFTSDKKQLEDALYAFGTDRDGDTFHMDSGFHAKEYWERQGSYDQSRSGPNTGRDTQTGLEGLDIPTGNDRFGADEQLGEVLLNLEQSMRQRMATQAIGYMSNFKAFAENLRVVNGRKNLVLFSSSFDGSLAMGTGGERGGARSASSNMGDAGNLHSGTMLDAAQRMIEALQGSGAVVFAIDTSAAGMQLQKSSLHMLNNFSSSTGGRMFANARDMGKALRRIQSITNQYYLVNIRPELPSGKVKKGELASVRVKVNRPKTKVYTSKGLLLEPDFQRMSIMERKLMLSEYISRDIIALPIPVEMDVIQVPGAGETARLNVTVQIEGDYLLTNGDPNLAGEFELFLLAVDRKTDELISQHYHAFAVVPEGSRNILEKTGLAYFGDLGVPDGSYKIKLILRNLRNGHTASMIRDVDVKSNSIASAPLELTQTPWLEIQKKDIDDRPADDLIQIGPKVDEKDPFPYRFADGAQFLPTADRILEPGSQATFIQLIDGEKAAAFANAVSMAAVITDGKGGNQVAQPAGLRFKLFQPKAKGSPAGLAIALDLNGFKLEKGKDYTLLTRINLGNQPPALAQFPFTVAN